MKSVIRFKSFSMIMTAFFLLLAITLPASAESLKPMEGIEGPFAGGGWEFPTKPIKIAVWWHEYGPFTAYVRELIDRYQQLHPNVTIEAVVASQTDINQKLTVALASGTGPHIFDQDISFFSAYYDKGVLEPINREVFKNASLEAIRAEYIGNVIEGVSFDGNIYGLPFQTNSMSYVHNLKAYKEAGLDFEKDHPITWEDLKRVGARLKKVKDGKTVQKGYDFPYQSKRWQLQAFQPMVEQFGGTILSPDKKHANLSEPPAIKALELWKSVTAATGDPSYSLATPSDPNADFIDGRTAIWYTGPWATNQLKERFGQPYKDWAFTSMAQLDPKKPRTMMYGFTWGVNKTKDKLEKMVAWDFIRFMLAKPDEWLKKASFIQPRAGLLQTEAAKNFPYIDVHLKDVETASWYVRSVNTNELVEIVGRAIEKATFQGVAPEKALKDADAEAEKILNGK
jgi:multiple sugar transport system substrate-binding protein